MSLSRSVRYAALSEPGVHQGPGSRHVQGDHVHSTFASGAVRTSERGDRVTTMTIDGATREELFEALTHACRARDFAYIDRLLDLLLDLA